MIYSLLVLSSPVSGHGARHAAFFASSLIARGHQLRRVFFLDDGSYAELSAEHIFEDYRLSRDDKIALPDASG